MTRFFTRVAVNVHSHNRGKTNYCVKSMKKIQSEIFGGVPLLHCQFHYLDSTFLYKPPRTHSINENEFQSTHVLRSLSPAIERGELRE